MLSCKKFVSILVGGSAEDQICKTTIASPCHVDAMSAVMYLEARCDTQTFELAVMQKICPSGQFCIWGAVDLQDYDNLLMSCASDVSYDAW